MKTFLLSAFSIFFYSAAFAQLPVNVTYSTDYIFYSGRDKDSNALYHWVTSDRMPHYKLSINERSISFFRNLAAPAPTKRTYNVHPSDNPASAFYNDGKGHLYSPAAPITERALMVRDSVVNVKWVFTSDTDTILGYQCRRATAVLPHGYLNAWYAWDLPAGYGPFNYTGLPGTVLVVDGGSFHYSAISVDRTPDPFIIPETSLMDRAQYASLSREKRMYRAGLFGKKVDPYEVPRTTRIFRF